MNTIKKLMIIVLCILYNTFSLYRYEDFRGKVIFLDVGQGDSILIITKDNYSILVDTGGGIKSSFSISKYWWNKYLDYVIITHGDLDHYGGIYDIERNFFIKNLYFIDEDVLPSVNRVKKLQEKHKIGCCLTMSYFNLQGSKHNNSNNDNSLGILVETKDKKIFLSGDITVRVEQNISDELPNIDLLKVSHHGSKHSTSKDFLEYTKPKHAVISVGENNYGHPDNRVLNDLKNIGCNIYRTDIDGDIIFDLE